MIFCPIQKYILNVNPSVANLKKKTEFIAIVVVFFGVGTGGGGDGWKGDVWLGYDPVGLNSMSR